MRILSILAAICFALPSAATLAESAADRPNILLILADDLGYGDVGCYNPQSRIPTPNLDRLAAQGMRFTDAHSPCTVCTPTRYSVMTGQMAFRVPRGGTVFTGAGGPSLIAPDRLTLPEMLRSVGYTTACIGKWHVGMTFYDKDGQPIHKGGLDGVKQIDYSRPITGGPIDSGFDQFFGTTCCPTTDWLYAFIDGNRVPNPPTGLLDKGPLPKHPYANDNRRGMVASDFDVEEVDMVFLQKSKEFLASHVKNSPERPFFLFHSAQAVHLPSFPGRQFKGKTQSGPHGDFIFELDYVVGELTKELERLGIADNTLVVFTSDNGPEVPTVYHMREDHQHDGARPWRGVKRDNWEGGHRVPFIARWPGKVKAGSTSDQTTSLTDLMATVAEIVDVELPNDAAEDSFSMLRALLGEDEKPIRPYILQQGFGGTRYLAIRRGNWKYLAHKGSGGNRYETHAMLKKYQLPDTAPDAPGQLYDLDVDPGETKNVYFEHPEIAKELQSLLEESLESGRSVPAKAAAAAEKTATRPNIIVILADDLGYADTSVYDGWVKTPQLERLAAEGLTFTDFHTNSSVCSPTRAGFLTGRYQQRVGIVDVIARHLDTPGLYPSELTIPRLMKQGGYRTAIFGKWHLGMEPKFNPIHHGFDEFRGYLDGLIDYHVHDKTWHNGLKVEDQPGYSTHLITKNAVDFIERNTKDPFFLYVAHESVHLPFHTPDDTPENRKPIPKSEFWSHERIQPKYKIMLEEMDKGIGQILDTVKQTGMAERTLIFFLSDNGAIGAGSNKPFRGGKFSHYEGGHRVPAIAWWPGKIKAGSKTDQFAVAMDLLPTLTELAGIDVPAERKLDGISIRGLLLDGDDLPQRRVFFGYEPKLGTAMRDGHWKMIVKGSKVELYDLTKDIGEVDNLVEKYPERAKEMQTAIEDWKEEVAWEPRE